MNLYEKSRRHSDLFRHCGTWLIGESIVTRPVIAISSACVAHTGLKDKGKAVPGIKWTSKIILVVDGGGKIAGMNLGVIFQDRKQPRRFIICTISTSLIAMDSV